MSTEVGSGAVLVIVSPEKTIFRDSTDIAHEQTFSTNEMLSKIAKISRISRGFIFAAAARI